jgi:hypothetical protein
MGRIQRITLAAEVGDSIDLATTTRGSILVQNIGTAPLLVSYIRNPDGSAITAAPYSASYYTIPAGVAYEIPQNPDAGYVSQDQSLYFYSVLGTTVEIWVQGG